MSDRGANIIGDEIYYEGSLVALIIDSPETSILADFRHGFLNATLFEDEQQLCDFCTKEIESGARIVAETDADEAYDAALDDLISGIKPFVKGGLVRYADLSRIAQQLKDESE